MAYLDDPLLAEGLAQIRNKLLTALCQQTGLKLRSCREFEIYIFNYGQPEEKGFIKVDFGKYNQKIFDGGGTLTEELTEEERKNVKTLMPKIENQVNKHIPKNAGEFHILNADHSLIKNIAVTLNFDEWFVILDVELVDAKRELQIFPINNGLLKKWRALPEMKPKFIEYVHSNRKDV